MKIKKVNAPKSELVVKGQVHNCLIDCVRFSGNNVPNTCKMYIDAYQSVEN